MQCISSSTLSKGNSADLQNGRGACGYLLSWLTLHSGVVWIGRVMSASAVWLAPRAPWARSSHRIAQVPREGILAHGQCTEGVSSGLPRETSCVDQDIDARSRSAAGPSGCGEWVRVWTRRIMGSITSKGLALRTGMTVAVWSVSIRGNRLEMTWMLAID